MTNDSMGPAGPEGKDPICAPAPIDARAAALAAKLLEEHGREPSPFVLAAAYSIEVVYCRDAAAEDRYGSAIMVGGCAEGGPARVLVFGDALTDDADFRWAVLAGILRINGFPCGAQEAEKRRVSMVERLLYPEPWAESDR